MIRTAKKQQELTGKTDAAVSFVVPGKWPDGGFKRLAKRSGPLGQCVAEFEADVLCLFKADEVVAFCEQLI